MRDLLCRMGLAVVGLLWVGTMPAAEPTEEKVGISPVGRNIEILAPGREFRWKVSLPAVEKASWWVCDWNGEAISPVHPLEAGKGTVEIRYQPVRLGWQELVIETSRQGQPRQQRRGFISGQSRKLSPADFKYGVCTHIGNLKKVDPRDLELIDQLGVAYVRDDVSWNKIQPVSRNQWTWDVYDLYIAELTRRNIQLDAILAFAPEWAWDTARPWKALPPMEPWLEYVRATVERYKKEVTYWEIWNEPDIGFWRGTVAQYAELFDRTVSVIKQADPDCKILNGGFAIHPRLPNLQFLDEFLPVARRDNWDIFAFHDYRSFDDLLTNHKYVTGLQKKYGYSQPLWMNEGGLSSMEKGSEKFQAVTLVKKLSTAPFLDLESYFLYDIKDDGVNPMNGEHHFGLMHIDYSAKPAFAVSQNLIRLLGKKKYDRSFRIPELQLWAHLYRSPEKGEKAVAILWTHGALGSTLLWFPRMQGAEVLDVMGNPVEGPVHKEGSFVVAGDEPVYLQAAASDWNPRVVISTSTTIPLVLGEENQSVISLTNPLNRPVKVSYETCQLSSGLRSFKGEEVELAAGQTRQVPVSVPCDSTSSKTAPQAFLQFVLDGAQGRLKLPVTRVTRLPKVEKNSGKHLADTEEGAVFDLSQSKSIHNLFHAEPREEMHWHGVADLSAEARMAYDAEALWFTVVVTDDAQDQKNPADQLWKGDSLQISIQVNVNDPETFDLTLARSSAGVKMGWIYNVPGASAFSTGKVDFKDLPAEVRRDGQRTTYFVKVPWNALGVAQPPQAAFRLNLLVNDADGLGRKQWAELSGGLGQAKQLDRFPWVICGK